MDKILMEQIEFLPPLNSTTVELINILKEQKKSKDNLLKIIKKDPFIVATLFRTANSALFGFKNKFDSIENIIDILGINLVLSIAIGSSIKSSFDIDLSVYEVSVDDFKTNNTKMISLLNRCNIDIKKKENSFLPLFLIDIGKGLISVAVKKSNKVDDFKKNLKDDNKFLTDIEKSIINSTSYDVTHYLLYKWNFPDDILNIISDFINNKNLLEAKIIDIITTLCDIRKPCSEKQIKLALEKIDKYNLCDNIIDDIKKLN